MIGGKWARGGRAQNEMYGLEFGDMLRFHIGVEITTSAGEHPWHARLNTISLGTFATFEEAVAGVKSEARQRMARILEDWERFQVEPDPKRRSGRRR